jgi:hypothetical protein
VSHFLLVYDRSKGELLAQERFDTAAGAMAARRKAESAHRGSDGIEVVALSAESEEALRETHARYFLGLKELVARRG